MEQEKDQTIGDLFGGLIEDGENLIRAEARLYRAIAVHRARKAKSGIAALAVAALLGLSGLVAFLVGIVLGLAPLVGPVLAGLIVFAVAGIAAFLLARFAAGKFADLAGDEEEKAALAAGERFA